MNADRQAMLFGGAIDRPIAAMAERPVAHHQQQQLDETWIGRATLDLSDGEFDVLRRHQDRGAQPRLAVEPFMGDVAVHRLAQGRRHIGIVERDRAMQDIGNGKARAERIECLRAQRVEATARHTALWPPIGPRRMRQVRRIARKRERRVIDVALAEMLAPEVVEIRLQCRDIGHGGMNVTIDRARKRNLHRKPRAAACRAAQL